jgi:hypothetical protein
MKKIILTLLVLIVFFASSCNQEPIDIEQDSDEPTPELDENTSEGAGETFLAYCWTYPPLFLADENPSTPNTVTNGKYFPTDTGEFYMEYTAYEGSSYWVIYTIVANSGSSTAEGDPAYYQLWLNASGPKYYRYNYSIGETSASQDLGIINSEFPISAYESSEVLKKSSDTTGYETITSGDLTINIKYKRIDLSMK